MRRGRVVGENAGFRRVWMIEIDGGQRRAQLASVGAAAQRAVIGVAGRDRHRIFVVPRVGLGRNVRHQQDFAVADPRELTLLCAAALGSGDDAAAVRAALVKGKIAAGQSEYAVRVEDVVQLQRGVCGGEDGREPFPRSKPAPRSRSAAHIGQKGVWPRR
ncbi:hypothetical protein LDFHOB_09310 [Candidatus Electronema aureum]